LKLEFRNLLIFKSFVFFNYFSSDVLAGISSSLEEIQSGVSDSTKNRDSFMKLENMLYSSTSENLNPEDSAFLARKLLLAMAQDKTLSPVLETALDEHRDDELPAGDIIAVGVAISMILVSATASLEGTAFGIEFRKETADAELVESVLSPAAEIFSGFQGQ
jgi:hypothetical protein